MAYSGSGGKDFAKYTYSGGIQTGHSKRYKGKDPSQVYKDAQALLSQLSPSVSSGMPVGGSSPNRSGNMHVDFNAGQLAQSRAKAGLISGQPVPTEQPSLMSRIFDILSRGQYMTAGAANSAAQAVKGGDGFGAIDDFFLGAARGLMGKRKDSWSDVLDTVGVENNLVKGVVGFAGDVFLDPTTYLGVGAIKKLGKEAVEGATAKAATTAIEATQGTSREALRLKKQIKKAIEDAKKQSGKKLTPAQTKKIGDEIKESYVLRTAQAEGAKAALQGQGKVVIKWRGKPILESPTAYEWAATALNPLRNVPGVEAANMAFRTKALYGALNPARRFHESRGIGELTDWERMWREQTKGLTSTDASRIAHAIEDNLVSGLGLGEKGADLEKIADMAKGWQDQFANAEINAGILKQGQVRPNYVYHVLRGGDEVAQKAHKTKRKLTPVGTNNPNFTLARKVPTLRDAANLGLDPVTDIRDIVAARAAKHYRAIARKNFLEEASTNFGLKSNIMKGGKLPAVTKKVADKLDLVRLSNTDMLDEEILFPRHIAKILDGIEELANKPEEAKKFMQFMDGVTRAWKTGATVVNPGHHLRNSMSDIFTGYMDDVRDPRRYAQAMKIVTRNPTAKVKIANQMFSGDELYKFFVENGLKSGFFPHEMGKFTPTNVAGRGLEKVRQFAESREDWTRAAHMLDVLVKESKGKNWTKANKLVELEKLGRVARERVVKFKFDYGDLTAFERRVMRRAIPFYTWQRKNIPLMLESLAARPGKFANVPKLQRSINELLGRDENELKSIESRVPHYIRETNPFLLRAGSEPLYSNFGLPINDLASLGGESGMPSPLAFLKNQLGALHPIPKAAIELTQDKQLFGGMPVPAEKSQYAANQLPLGRLLYNQTQRKGEIDPRQMNRSWVNWATGLGLQQANYQRQSGELQRQKDLPEKILKEARKRLREQAGLENKWGY